MISTAQLNQLRGLAHRTIAETFPTTITIGEHADIPAARWASAKASENQPFGTLLPTVDIVVRVARADLVSRSIAIFAGKTIFIEDGVKYRVERRRSGKGDPGIVLEGKTA